VKTISTFLNERLRTPKGAMKKWAIQRNWQLRVHKKKKNKKTKNND
jgi:hypothetical protein